MLGSSAETTETCKGHTRMAAAQTTRADPGLRLTPQRDGQHVSHHAKTRVIMMLYYGQVALDALWSSCIGDTARENSSKQPPVSSATVDSDQAKQGSSGSRLITSESKWLAIAR
eukprot:667679-Rhodomonas_salina.2